ncbi:MAG: hypothetical protein WCK49_06045 [Myxococcaceae bacterium]
MKIFVMSLGILFATVSAWLVADLCLFQEQKAEHEILVKKIADQNCVYSELIEIEQQGQYRRNFDAILNAEYEALQKKIPETTEASSVLELLTQIAEDTEVILGDVKTQKGHFQVTLLTRFPNLVKFLKEIAKQEQIIVVENLKYGFERVEIDIKTYSKNWTLKPRLMLPALYHCGEIKIPAEIDVILAIPEFRYVFKNLVRDPFVVPSTSVAEPLKIIKKQVSP